ncbi:MAG: hypothetical protein ACYC5A_11090 [Thermoleophilia bacterium]
MKMRMFAVLVLGLMLALAVTGIALGQQSVCEQITFSTTTGTPGAAVNVYGDAYNGAGVSVLWNGVSVGSATADEYGMFSIDFNVPADATAGAHTVTVVIEYEGTDECPTPFVVEALATAPAAETPTGSKPLSVLPSTGFMLLPAGALAAAGLALFASRRRSR